MALFITVLILKLGCGAEKTLVAMLYREASRTVPDYKIRKWI
jgi:hypothetical protein